MESKGFRLEGKALLPAADVADDRREVAQGDGLLQPVAGGSVEGERFPIQAQGFIAAALLG
jgi:hypothetical protein